MRIALSNVWRSREFAGQTENTQFGGINLSLAIDSSGEHLIAGAIVWQLPFGPHDYQTVDDISRPIRDSLSTNIVFINATIEAIEHNQKQVDTSAERFDYDWLISAMGCRVAPEAVDGLSEAFDDAVHTFYTPDSALRLRTALSVMQSDRAERQESTQNGPSLMQGRQSPVRCLIQIKRKITQSEPVAYM